MLHPRTSRTRLVAIKVGVNGLATSSMHGGPLKRMDQKQSGTEESVERVFDRHVLSILGTRPREYHPRQNGRYNPTRQSGN